MSDDYLEHCVPWTGPEKDLPAGIVGMPAGIFITDLIKSVTVIDPQSETGLNVIPYENVKHDMKIINVKLNEEVIKEIDPDGRIIMLVDPDGGKHITREEWFNTPARNGNPRETDGLALWAATRIYLKARGGGVTSYNPKL